MYSRREVLKIGAGALSTAFAVPSQEAVVALSEGFPFSAFSNLANLYDVLLSRVSLHRSDSYRNPEKSIICFALNWAKDQGCTLPSNLEDRDQIRALVSKYIESMLLPVSRAIDSELNKLRINNREAILGSFGELNIRTELHKSLIKKYGIQSGQIVWNSCYIISNDPDESFNQTAFRKLNYFYNFHSDYKLSGIRDFAQNILDTYHRDIQEQLDSKNEEAGTDLAKEFILRESFCCERQKIYDCIINNGLVS